MQNMVERVETYVESLNQAGESEIVLAKHFQRLECLVVRPILEFQSNYIFPCSIPGELKGNSGGVVGYLKSYELKHKTTSYCSLTNSRYLWISHRGIGDVE